MPKRTDISSIMIIGAGPIIIGQAAEFDYSGSQAVKALTAEGYRVIVVNSNPATVMTDPELVSANGQAGATAAQRLCVLRWARKNHLKFVFVEAINFPAES